MSVSNNAQLPDLVIADTLDVSNEVVLEDFSGVAIMLLGQSDIPAANTYSIQVRERGGAWCTLQSPAGTDIVIVKSGKAQVLSESACAYSFRIKSNAAMSTETATWKALVTWTSQGV